MELWQLQVVRFTHASCWSLALAGAGRPAPPRRRRLHRYGQRDRDEVEVPDVHRDQGDTDHGVARLGGRVGQPRPLPLQAGRHLRKDRHVDGQAQDDHLHRHQRPAPGRSASRRSPARPRSRHTKPRSAATTPGDELRSPAALDATGTKLAVGSFAVTSPASVTVNLDWDNAGGEPDAVPEEPERQRRRLCDQRRPSPRHSPTRRSTSGYLEDQRESGQRRGQLHRDRPARTPRPTVAAPVYAAHARQRHRAQAEHVSVGAGRRSLRHALHRRHRQRPGGRLRADGTPAVAGRRARAEGAGQLPEPARPRLPERQALRRRHRATTASRC